MLDERVNGAVNRGRNRYGVFRRDGMAARIRRDSFDFDNGDTPGRSIASGRVTVGRKVSCVRVSTPCELVGIDQLRGLRAARRTERSTRG